MNADVLLNCIVPNVKGRKVGRRGESWQRRTAPRSGEEAQGIQVREEAEPGGGTVLRGDETEILKLGRKR